jgi:hypothetical protein
METKVFQFSVERIKTTKNRMLLLGLLVMPIAIFFIALVNAEGDNLDTSTRIGIFVVTLAMFEVILAVVSALMLRRIKELEIRVSNENIERKGGKSVESIAYQDLTRIVVRENKSGDIIGIQLYSPPRQVPIAGFNDMNLLLNEIVQRIPDGVEIRRKRTSIDWNHPFVFLLLVVLTMAATLGLFTYVERLGEDVYEFFIALFLIAVGAFNLIYRPVSKSVGARFRRFETVINTLEIVCGILLLVLQAVKLIK